MTIAVTITHRNIAGDVIRVTGKYVVSDDAEGGDIDAQMDICDWIKLEHDAGAVIATQSVANETFPCPGHAVTIVTPANESGRFFAEGRGRGY